MMAGPLSLANYLTIKHLNIIKKLFLRIKNNPTYSLKYGFLKKLLQYECTSCQLNISSHQNQNGGIYNTLQHVIYYERHAVIYCVFPHSNFDDWMTSTGKRCIRNEITSQEIHTLDTSVLQVYSMNVPFAQSITRRLKEGVAERDPLLYNQNSQP